METVNLSGAYEDRMRFSVEETNIVKRALKSKLFQRTGGSLEERLPKFQTLLDELSANFSVTVPQLRIHPAMQQHNASGFQLSSSGEIFVGRLSLTSALNAFAMHLYSQTENGGGDGEDFAKSFGLSLFKQSAPRMFESAKSNGRLMNTDTTYTDGGAIQAQNAPPAETEASEEDGDEDELDNPNGED